MFNQEILKTQHFNPKDDASSLSSIAQESAVHTAESLPSASTSSSDSASTDSSSLSTSADSYSSSISGSSM